MPEGATQDDAAILGLVGQLRASLIPASDQTKRQQAESALAAAGDLNARLTALQFELQRYGGQPVFSR